jgi:hypothetical protein
VELDMKYDNTFLKDLLDEGKAILKEEEALNERKKALEQQKKDYIKEYFSKFGTEDLSALAISTNTFVENPKFFIRENESGKISWIARGSRTTVKDGKVTYGHAQEELWQGQWEALPEGLRKLTIEDAKENTKPGFSMSPAIFAGVDFAAPAYILHENEDGLQLVWRKSGTAYTGRFSGSSASSSGLQILYAKKHENFRQSGEKAREAWNKISEAYHTVTGKKIQFVTTHTGLTEGGRLSVGLLEKEESKIDLIFGSGTTQGIIEKLKLQQENKNKKKKELKGLAVVEEQSTQPKKLKL